MPRTKKVVEDSLRRKGFSEIETHHHCFVYVTLQGKRSSVRTKTSHTQKMKDIPDNLLSEMAKQAQLSRKEFLQLIDCPLSREEYERILVERGIV